jgi:uncharacterized protein (TIGR00730 family)
VRITVFAGSSRRSPEPYLSAARELGREIARRGHVLVFGGGRTGLMGAVATGVLETGGRAEGVILRRFIEEDVHHPHVELLAVDDMRARKAGLDTRGEAFVALPGGLGTLEELAEMLSFRKLGLHTRPLVLFDVAGFYAGLVAQLSRAHQDGFESPEHVDWYTVTDDPVRAVRLCEGEPAPWR